MRRKALCHRGGRAGRQRGDIEIGKIVDEFEDVPDRADRQGGRKFGRPAQGGRADVEVAQQRDGCGMRRYLERAEPA